MQGLHSWRLHQTVKKYIKRFVRIVIKNITEVMVLEDFALKRVLSLFLPKIKEN